MAQIKNCLLDKKVQLVPIPKPHTHWIKKADGTVDVSEATMMTSTSRSIVLPMKLSTGRLVDPLTDSERTFLEKKLGIDLDVNAKEDNFWSSREATIRIHKTSRDLNSATLEFNLNDPYEYILYKICLVSGRVANSWEERGKRPHIRIRIKRFRCRTY